MSYECNVATLDCGEVITGYEIEERLEVVTDDATYVYRSDGLGPWKLVECSGPETPKV